MRHSVESEILGLLNLCRFFDDGVSQFPACDRQTDEHLVTTNTRFAPVQQVLFFDLSYICGAIFTASVHDCAKSIKFYGIACVTTHDTVRLGNLSFQTPPP